jgi:fumarylacetoacetate (FAA) hydrolase
MKLATLKDGTRDGKLVLVSRNLQHMMPVDDICPTLQAALDDWEAVEPRLRKRADALNAARGTGCESFDPSMASAPLPRCYQWLDGSAFESHGKLMAKVFHIENPQSDRPLMYQGMSHEFISGTDDVLLPSEDDGIDFEGEFGIITDSVPMGVKVSEAASHIKLIVPLHRSR